MCLDAFVTWLKLTKIKSLIINYNIDNVYTITNMYYLSLLKSNPIDSNVFVLSHSVWKIFTISSQLTYFFTYLFQFYLFYLFILILINFIMISGLMMCCFSRFCLHGGHDAAILAIASGLHVLHVVG